LKREQRKRDHVIARNYREELREVLEGLSESNLRESAFKGTA
jgi:hypothetical protein